MTNFTHRLHLSGDDTHTSWMALALTPVTVVAGFVLGSILVGDPNAVNAPHGFDAAWRVVALWVFVVAAPAAGVWFGARGTRAHDLRARLPLILNALAVALLTVTTLFGEMINPS